MGIAMARSAATILSVVLLVIFVPQALAQSTMKQGAAASSLPSAGDEIKLGDELKLEADTPIFRDIGGSQTVYCAPAGSRFRVDEIDTGQSTTLSATDSGGKAINAVQQKQAATTTTTITGASTVTQSTSEPTLSIHFPSYQASSPLLPAYWFRQMFPDVRPVRSGGKCDAKSGTPPVLVNPTVVDGGQYEINPSELKKYSYQRSGFTWGGMVIPYKFELSDHSFKASPTLAAFIGYEGWWPGVSLANVLIVGGGAVSQTTTSPSTVSGSVAPSSSSSTNQSTSTNATYSAGIGEIATFGGAFKAGLVLGWDWEGRNTGFKYEAKPWLAVSVGAGF